MSKLRILPLVIVGAVLASFVVPASPASAAKMLPSGGAIVSITGDTASIANVQPRKYQIVFPKSQTIKWLGEVRGLNGARVGTFSGKELASRWTALRKGSKSPARATLSWKGKDRWVLSKVSAPRINEQGLLVMDLATPMSLPRRIKDFNLSIDRAPKSGNLRWNTTTQSFGLTDATSLQTTVNGNADTLTQAVGNGTNCFFDGIPIDGNGKIATVPGVTCADVVFLPMSTIQVIEASPTAQGWEQAVLFLQAYNSENTEIFAIIANWDYEAS